jgi:crotonobetainyl-CoA:carnitine CoA-transferase CaiB-like acyl-CoA transferase
VVAAGGVDIFAEAGRCVFDHGSPALASGAVFDPYFSLPAALAGGSPRYQLYPTRDGRLVACAALEQKFWLAFSAAIGLAPEFVDDRADPAATKAAVAAIIASKSAEEWGPKLAEADCCVTIMMTLEEALRDPHFVARGLFAHEIVGSSGTKTMPALPVPIDPSFRADPSVPKSAPKLSEPPLRVCSRNIRFANPEPWTRWRCMAAGRSRGVLTGRY